MSKALVLYHANCADGFAAAYSTWMALGDDAEYVPVQYGDAPPDVTGKLVYILDFSYAPEVVDAMAADAEHVTLLDHHKTAMEQWGPVLSPHLAGGASFHRRNLDVYFDMERSGAQMAWDWFYPGVERPRIIDHVADRDLWRFALPGTKAVCAALNSYPYDFKLWDCLSGYQRHMEMLTEGAAILRMQAQRVEHLVADSLRAVQVECCSPEGLRYVEQGLAANVRENISEVGHDIAKKSGTFSLTFFIKGDEAICSLRSIGDYDVTPIAKKYGGGGHKNAAGFKMPVARFFAEVWK